MLCTQKDPYKTVLTGNEFTGRMTQLKAETYSFWIRGGDYTTGRRTVVVVPPPTLVEIVSEENRPAYLYYRLDDIYRRPDGADPADLRGKKQAFEPEDITSVGSDISLREVPTGTDVTIRATANSKLDPESIDLAAVKEGERPHLLVKSKSLERSTNPEIGDTIILVFENVRQDIRFRLNFRNPDGVSGHREIHIKPRDDQPPEWIDVKPGIENQEGNAMEVIRKTKDGYLVTHQARIPFMGKVRDDNGLAAVRYACTVARIETASATVDPRRLLPFAGYPGIGSALPMLLKETVRYQPIPAFAAELDRRLKEQKEKGERPELLPLQEVLGLLDQKQKSAGAPLLKFFKLTRDSLEKKKIRLRNGDEKRSTLYAGMGMQPSHDFPLWKLELQLPSGNRNIVQPRYKMQLWVEAIDTDVDTEPLRDGKTQPHISPTKEKFQFLVVGENDLLIEIGGEEQLLRQAGDGLRGHQGRRQGNRRPGEQTGAR